MADAVPPPGNELFEQGGAVLGPELKLGLELTLGWEHTLGPELTLGLELTLGVGGSSHWVQSRI
jgi:hypothetical protein